MSPLTDHALEAVAIHQNEDRLIFDPVEHCIAADVAAITPYLPSDLRVQLTVDLRELVRLQKLEGAEEQILAHELDRLERREGGPSTVKQIAATIREPLAAITGGASAHEVLAARNVLRAAIAAHHPDKLASRSLRNELGGRRHDVVLSLLGRAA